MHKRIEGIGEVWRVKKLPGTNVYILENPWLESRSCVNRYWSILGDVSALN